MEVPTVNKRPVLIFNLNRFPRQNLGSHLPSYLADNSFLRPGKVLVWRVCHRIQQITLHLNFTIQTISTKEIIFYVHISCYLDDLTLLHYLVFEVLHPDILLWLFFRLQHHGHYVQRLLLLHHQFTHVEDFFFHFLRKDIFTQKAAKYIQSTIFHTINLISRLP